MSVGIRIRSKLDEVREVMVGKGIRMASSCINIGGIELNYVLNGPTDAPVVCLNHCFASDHRYWDSHLSAFEGFRVLRHDARGHGESGKPLGPYTLEMMAADIVGLLDALGIDEVHICGVSMGGMIAQTMALDHPDRVASIALVNTTAQYSEKQRQSWRDRAALVWEDGMDAVRGPLLARWFSGAAAAACSPGYVYMEEMLRGFTAASFDAASAAMCGLNTMSRLPQINVPAIVIATPDDPGVSTETSKMMAEALGAPLHWLKPAQHLASLEHVESFNELMRQFLVTVLQTPRL